MMIWARVCGGGYSKINEEIVFFFFFFHTFGLLTYQNAQLKSYNFITLNSLSFVLGLGLT